MFNNNFIWFLSFTNLIEGSLVLRAWTSSWRMIPATTSSHNIGLLCSFWNTFIIRPFKVSLIPAIIIKPIALVLVRRMMKVLITWLITAIPIILSFISWSMLEFVLISPLIKIIILNVGRFRFLTIINRIRLTLTILVLLGWRKILVVSMILSFIMWLFYLLIIRGFRTLSCKILRCPPIFFFRLIILVRSIIILIISLDWVMLIRANTVGRIKNLLFWESHKVMIRVDINFLIFHKLRNIIYSYGILR